MDVLIADTWPVCKRLINAFAEKWQDEMGPLTDLICSREIATRVSA
jgi:hypothetical protein